MRGPKKGVNILWVTEKQGSKFYVAKAGKVKILWKLKYGGQNSIFFSWNPWSKFYVPWKGGSKFYIFSQCLEKGGSKPRSLLTNFTEGVPPPGGLYILTATFLSDRKSVGRNDSHIFCARPCSFSLPGWRHVSPGNHAHLHRRRHAQKCKYYTHCYPSILATASLTTCAVAMKNALFQAIKISEFGKWVERHNGDHVTSDDVTGDR